MPDNIVTTGTEIESAAFRMAQEAGKILAGYFGHQIKVKYKDEAKNNPVTAADEAVQEHLVAEIARQFPDHGILAEEDAKELTTPVPDFLWVLDPLDGTTNFLNGLPIYASSIGVLFKGRPIAGALFLPWPGSEGGVIFHCRRGGGCFANNEPVTVHQSEEPTVNRLTGFPAFFDTQMKFKGKVRNPYGEMRTTGSIAYELAMTACGVMQYSFFRSPCIWDVAAGALAVIEAQGTVLTKFRKERQWHPMDTMASGWEANPPTYKDLVHWRQPVVAGNPQVAPLIAANMRRRFRPLPML